MGVSMHFVMSSAPGLHDELQCIHNLTRPPGFLTGDEQHRSNETAHSRMRPLGQDLPTALSLNPERSWRAPRGRLGIEPKLRSRADTPLICLG